MIVCCNLYDWFQHIPAFAGVVRSLKLVSALETRVVHPLPFALPSIATFPFPIFAIGSPISCFLRKYLIYIDIHIRYFSDFSTQVEKRVRLLKHKLRPDNAYFKLQS
jgi:hypothetical protein